MEQPVLTDCTCTHVLGNYCYICNWPSRYYRCYRLGTM